MEYVLSYTIENIETLNRHKIGGQRYETFSEAVEAFEKVNNRIRKSNNLIICNIGIAERNFEKT